MEHEHDPHAILISPVAGKTKYVVEADWRYGDWMVPHGFHTDGASIPRWLWGLIGGPFSAQFIEAAILHDFLYQKRSGYTASRKTADAVFYEILRDNKVHPVRAWVMWVAVRTFGWPFWKRRF